MRRVNGEVAPSTHTAVTENSRSVEGGGRGPGRSGLTTESGDQRREVTISQILVIIVVVFLVTQSFKVSFAMMRLFRQATLLNMQILGYCGFVRGIQSFNGWIGWVSCMD